MEKFVKGDIVVVPFPFSDLSALKKRPAVVITSLKGKDLILAQITSKNIKDEYSIPIGENDFNTGSLKQNSNVRPNRSFPSFSAFPLNFLHLLN
ncbi:MAG TPA: type II toxin-antitoxin system PemK/MazF family toxin [Spirochaetes bacterium]|nr:type II toxin-antitoxin system PemK/MazF family toxin [Spirochaetota bacterium]